MFSGGLGSPTLCVDRAEFQTVRLYNIFRGDYDNARYGADWRAYEKKYTTEEGLSYVVQLVSSSNRIPILKIFGNNGKELARASSKNCFGWLTISKEQKAKGADVLIQSALQAFTGQFFGIEVE